MPSAKPYVGIDLGGTNMQVGVVSADLKMLSRAKRKTKPDEGRDAVIDRIVDAINEACQEAKIALADLGGVGIGAPGAVDPRKGVVIEAVNLRWNDLALADLLTKRLKVRTWLDNDVNVAVLGENRIGAGKGCEHLLGVWCGTGIGAGLILNGSLYYGDAMTAGEIGHTILFPGCPRGSRSLEHNCSRTAVVDRLVRLIRANHPSMIVDEVGGDLSAIKSKALGKCYEAGDKLVREVIDTTADMLGVGIANAATLLSLQRVVLGGGLTEAVGKPFVDRVQAAARALVFHDALRRLEVVASKLEDDAGVYGAAMIAADRAEEKSK
jgi:glucokinase